MKTILIVEDTKEIREEICDIFIMENFNVLEACDGKEAYSIAIDQIPDLIITDIIMPEYNGYTLFEKLKDNPVTDTIPVIFLSALSSQNDIRIGMNLGADDYLTKPVNPNFLIYAAKNKLEKYTKIQNKLEHLKVSLTQILHHELRTPLNGIIGLESIDIMKIEEVKEYLLHIQNSGYRLHKLIEKYLKFADLKINSMQNCAIKEYKNTSYINTFQIMNGIIKDNTLKYKRSEDIETGLIHAEIKIDTDLFTALMEELVENAFKFSKPGEKIIISSDITASRFKIRIYNEGIGMKQEQINEIGDFKQFNKHVLAQNGSGIGLSIVKLIADIYNIELSIISKHKAYFSVSLIIREIFRVP
jgi:two-component system sensor histidine kinase/response regulator